MRAVTHDARNNKYLFSLIKKKKKKGSGSAKQPATSPDLLNGRDWRGSEVFRSVGWLRGGALHHSLACDE